MIVDCSAVMAILLEEPDELVFAAAVAADTMPRISAGSWIELAAVITRKYGDPYHARLDKVADRMRLTIAPVTSDQALIGRLAYRRFGIGTGHPAGLNFGDCFSYALAQETGEPLLFKGEDFKHTDIAPAL